MQALEKKGNLTSRYAKKKKKAGLGFSFDSYIPIQDVDGRALGSQGVKEKKKKNVCSTVCRGWGIGHSFKRQVFFSLFFFFNHVDTPLSLVLSALSGTTETVPRAKQGKSRGRCLGG